MPKRRIHSRAPGIDPRRGLAALFDLLVVPALGGAGHRLHAASFDDRALDVDLRGRVYVVTGASAGLGRATTEALAARGATVLMLCRDGERGERARREIAERTGSDALSLHLVDVGARVEVKRFAAEFLASGRRLDGLVNNAGVLVERREVTDEGIERTFATNVLGPFLLTELLSPALLRSAPSRVVNVASASLYTQRLAVEDLEFARPGYAGVVAYGRSKRALLLLTERSAARLGGRGVTVAAMHPGWVDTPGLRHYLPAFHAAIRPLLRTVEQGADTIVWLAIAEAAAGAGGGFFFDRRPCRAHLPLAPGHSPPADVDALSATCARLAGLGA